MKTTNLIDVYNQAVATPMRFFSGFFQSPRKNFYTSQEVQLDIVRSEQDISVAVQDLSVGYRLNSANIYTTKSFKPPAHKEAVAVEAFDLMNRMPGQHSFQNPDFRANLISIIFETVAKIEAKIRRSIELQSAQVLQTGVATLINELGQAVHTVDYKPKASHFPTAGIAWSSGSSTKIADLHALIKVVNNDGLSKVDQLIFGSDAIESFLSDPAVQARFDNRRIDLGTMSRMQPLGQGGEYRGTVEIGTSKLDVYTYSGTYKHPQTGVITEYMAPNKVIVRSSTGRLDATFGAIPNIGQLLGAGAPILPELPGRMSNASGGMDLFTNAWLSDNGDTLWAGVGARPLMIPTAIDTFGCLTTGL